MFAGELALVVLVVVELDMVGFDAFEEEVGGFFEERVDAEVEGVEVGVERGGGGY